MRRAYPPSEDSELLLECVRRHAGRPRRALEVACGTGFIARGLLDAGSLGLAACGDISEEAALEASSRFRGTALEPIVCDSAEPFREGAFDLVYFNPPYLPCDPGEDPELCGGGKGVEVALEFLRSSARALRPGGRIYALVRAEGAGDLLEEARRLGLEGGVRCSRRLFFEELVVLEILKPLSRRRPCPSARSPGPPCSRILPSRASRT